MKILTTNTSGRDIFGGIHTHIQEYIANSPQHHFSVIENNGERKYVRKDNVTVRRLDPRPLVGSDNVLVVLEDSHSVEEVDEKSERIIKEFQTAIQIEKPDAVLIFGTSLPSYFLLNASERENYLNRTVHVYSGVLEKEILKYSNETQKILKSIGKSFTDSPFINNLTYVFPSNYCREIVEDIHGVKIENTHIIPNGVSQAFADNSTRRAPPTELTLGFIGRFVHVKNPDFFLGLKDTLEESVTLKTITDVAAWADEPLGKYLLRKMTNGEVFYNHPRPPNDLANFYKTELSTVIIPSLFETFSNVATESLVCGTPVLLSDRAGSKEIFKAHGLEELVFSIDDFESFKQALEFARSIDFKVSRKLSKEIYDELAWRNIIRKYNELVESSVGDKK